MSRVASSPYSKLRRRGVAALGCFVLGTLVVPALHLVDHDRAHVHTDRGVRYRDGQRDDGPRSLDDVLQAIRSAAFPNRDAARNASGPQLTRVRHEHAPHGAGSLLHFATAFQQGNAVVATRCSVQLLRKLVLSQPPARATRNHPETQHIRGPPSFA